MIPAEAYLMPLAGAVVKARKDASGKRVIEVEASSESVDSEGDVVLQKALLDSAASFVRSGHIDIDHISEIGHRIGIRNPTSYIIGRPLEVNDLGSKRTGVVAEIMRSNDGSFDPDTNRFDAFWKSLDCDPPVQWSASIYGYPTEIDDCTGKSCETGATRYVIKAIDWRSLAVTKNPINTSLRGYAKIVTAKAAIDFLREGSLFPFGMDSPKATRKDTGAAAVPQFCQTGCPTTMDSLWGNYHRHKSTCPYMSEGNSVATFKDHFSICCGAPFEVADLLAHALMYMILKWRKQNGPKADL